MNHNFYQLPNGHYDQAPSTSFPMQQVNNMPLKNPRLENVSSWMHPYRNAYNSSPAPSVHSSHSVMSAGSVASRMSQLSINTNFTEYSTMPTWNMMPSMGTENIYPVQQIHWTAQGVEAEVSRVINTLRNYELVNLERTQIQEVFQRLQWLVMDQSGREAQANVPIPFDCLSHETVNSLLGTMFGSLTFDEKKMELWEPRKVTNWNHLVNRILKYLFHIYRRLSNRQLTNKFDEIVDKLPGNPIRILASLLIPNKEFTLFAIKLFYFLVRSCTPRSKSSRIQELSKDTKCIDSLMRIVCPDQEYMNQMERQLSLECICSFLPSEKCQNRLTNSQLIPKMLRRYFVPNGEEQVLYKIPQILLKVSRRSKMKEQFFLQLESVRGYALIADMLSHGSPRVLLSCLNFLISLEPSTVQRISDLHQLIVATLRLAGSTDVHITKAALKFLHLATSNNPVANITKQNGVQCILACLRQNYSSIQDPNLNVSQISVHAAEIKTFGMEIICWLVKTPESGEYPTNPENAMAQSQVASYPHLTELVCNWMNENLDNGRLPMVNLLNEVLPRCDAETLNMILSKKVVLDDRSGEKCAAEILVGCLFTMYLKHDDIEAKNPDGAKTMQYLSSRLLYLFWRVFQRPGADILFIFLGRPSPPQNNLTNLFMESTSTRNVSMRHQLLQFMTILSSHDGDRKLLRGWAAHPHFQAVMEYFSRDPRCVASVQQIYSSLAQPPIVN